MLFRSQDFNASHDVGTRVIADVKAGYIEALYMLTGEKYADWYKNGAWGGIKPIKEFNPDTFQGGAWEVGIRYDAFDVNNVSVAGSGSRIGGSVASGTQNATTGDLSGGAKTYTAGIKWQLNPNMRILANYSHTKFDYAFSPVDLSSATTINKEDIFMLRTQFYF
mgnify:CR=1 FL=1